tara:strand:+ start:285 stop:470 length:186 start_codon:yes stop_codon:yes gene_type:complete
MYYKKKLKMNFRERGFTVGDLTLLLIVFFIAFFVINKIKVSKTQKQINNLYQIEVLKNINV